MNAMRAYYDRRSGLSVFENMPFLHREDAFLEVRQAWS